MTLQPDNACQLHNIPFWPQNSRQSVSADNCSAIGIPNSMAVQITARSIYWHSVFDLFSIAKKKKRVERRRRKERARAFMLTIHWLVALTVKLGNQMPSDRPPSHQFALPERQQQQQQQQQEQVAIVSRLRLHLKAHNMPADREEEKEEEMGEGAHSEMQLVPRTNAISRVSPNARNQLHLSAIPCFAILYYIVYTFSRCLCVVGRHILPAPHADVFWLGKMQITSRSKSQSAFPPRLVFDTPPWSKLNNANISQCPKRSHSALGK